MHTFFLIVADLCYLLLFAIAETWRRRYVRARKRNLELAQLVLHYMPEEDLKIVAEEYGIAGWVIKE